MPSCTHPLAKKWKAASGRGGDCAHTYHFSVPQHILMLK